MKLFNRIIYVITLIFSFQAPSLADDIRDFQIEGMSIGDSLLDYLTEKEIKKEEQNSTKMGKDFLIIYYYYKPSGSKLYDYVQVTYNVNDKKYLIHAIGGFLDFDDNIKACMDKKKEIQNEIKGLFKGAKIGHRKNKKHSADKSGKSKVWHFDITLKSGAWASVTCTDWSEKIYSEKKWKDALSISVRSAEYTEFLRKYYK